MAVADTERVIVHMHLGQSVVKKVWRFDPRRLQDYTRSKVEQELIDLFPDVSRQNLKLSLWYEDDLAGEVSVISCIVACVRENSIASGGRPLYLDGNEVREFTFWTLFPEQKALRNAKVFLLGQITLIIQEGKPSRSAERNPSTQVVLQIYNYDAATNSYHTGGRTSLMKSSILHVDVTRHIQGSTDRVSLPIHELHGYLPLSEDLDITSRLPSELTDDAASDEDSEEEFIAEQIVKKQFNAKLGQYEFLINWKDYAEKHNTWELISNIPEALLSSLEEAQQAPTAYSTPSRPGLCNLRLIKLPYNSDFI